MVNGHVFNENVGDVLSLPQVQGPVEWEFVIVIGKTSSTGAEAEGEVGIEASAIRYLRRMVLRNVDQEDEWHTTDAT